MEVLDELKRSARRRIGFGALAIATIPFVGVLAASYHVIVGIVVTTIYGAAALAVGTAYIATGVADRLRARTPPLQLPEARVIKAP